MEFRYSQLQHRSRPNARHLLSRAKELAWKHKKLLSIVLVAFFVFYWYEIRPIQINNKCTQQASADARALLKSKAEVATDPERRVSYINLIDKDMYLRSDFESYYSRCLRGYGINL